MFRSNLFIPLRLYDMAGSGAGGGTGAASTPSATPSSTSSSASAASTPAASTPAASAPASSSTPATPGAATPTADDLQDGNWRELRTRYESQKAQIADLTARSTAAAAVHTHAQQLSKTLGYTDQDFADAFAADPVKTLQILESEAAAKPSASATPQGQQPPDLNKQLEDMVNQRLTPIQDFQNRQATEVAMTKYESTMDGLIKADPIISTAPPEVVSLVRDYLGEYFSTQPQILLAMKTKGDYSAVPDAFKLVAGRLHSAFKSWLSKSQGGGSSTSASTAAAPKGARPSLDDIINDPGVLGAQYK